MWPTALPSPHMQWLLNYGGYLQSSAVQKRQSRSAPLERSLETHSHLTLVEAEWQHDQTWRETTCLTFQLFITEDTKVLKYNARSVTDYCIFTCQHVSSCKSRHCKALRVLAQHTQTFQRSKKWQNELIIYTKVRSRCLPKDIAHDYFRNRAWSTSEQRMLLSSWIYRFYRCPSDVVTLPDFEGDARKNVTWKER